MSLDLEQRLREFFASAPQTIHRIQTLEISHSAMSQTYFLWREPFEGEITTEDAAVHAVQPLNFEAKVAGSENNLDQVFEIPIDIVTEDAETSLRDELDAIPVATTERVQLVYREYLSDDLTEPLSIAPLEVESIAYAPGVAKVTAVSPRLNIRRTGEIYSPRDVPMLRSFL